MNSDLWTLFINEIHLLLGLAETDEAPIPHLEGLSGDRSRVYAACEYLANQNKAFATGATWYGGC